MKVYRIRGWFRQGLDLQRFTKEVPALSESQALERTYSLIGSRHKVKRNQINIEEIVEIGPGEVKDRRILEVIGG
ncbi:MAG: 50S ribosomal protein L18Ae [Candidatus Hadarchaeales archaeon]